jgi:hypothetical protein
VTRRIDGERHAVLAAPCDRQREARARLALPVMMDADAATGAIGPERTSPRKHHAQTALLVGLVDRLDEETCPTRTLGLPFDCLLRRVPGPSQLLPRRVTKPAVAAAGFVL